MGGAQGRGKGAGNRGRVGWGVKHSGAEEERKKHRRGGGGGGAEGGEAGDSKVVRPAGPEDGEGSVAVASVATTTGIGPEVQVQRWMPSAIAQ